MGEGMATIENLDLSAIEAVAERVEVIGNAVMVQGDCSLACLTFDDHVAGLAEANQIREFVGFVSFFEVAKRLDVMHRNRRANIQITSLAYTLVALYSSQSRFNPPTPTISGGTSDIVSRIRAGFFLCLVGAEAFSRTEPASALGPVGPCHPRFDLKLFIAVGAIMHLALHMVQLFRYLRGESVRWAHTLSPLVSDFVIVGHFSHRHVPYSPAFLTTETGGLCPVGTHGKDGVANLAVLSDRHLESLADSRRPVNGRRACHRIREAQRQGDMFTPQPQQPKPEQTGFDLA